MLGESLRNNELLGFTECIPIGSEVVLVYPIREGEGGLRRVRAPNLLFGPTPCAHAQCLVVLSFGLFHSFPVNKTISLRVSSENRRSLHLKFIHFVY